MFTCPACGRSYPPPTRFCSVDGTLLVAPAATPVAPAAANVVPWIVIGVLGLALIALAAVVLTRPQPTAAAPVAPAGLTTLPAGPIGPAPVAAAPVQVAPLPALPAPTSQFAPAPDFRVVSTPNDGYLSIRSAPDGGGSRLDKMLDGETIAVLSCGPARVVDGDPGHWCRVRRQSGQEGWAYDAYLFSAETSM